MDGQRKILCVSAGLLGAHRLRHLGGAGNAGGYSDIPGGFGLEAPVRGRRRGAGGVDAIRRGYLGLMLFIAALVLMPLLVFDYHRQTEAKADDNEPAPAASASVVASPVDAGAPERVLATPSELPKIVRFQGVEDGKSISGDVQITLVTIGDVGAINYTLSKYNGNWSARTAPYLFAPHSMGWRTTVVPNGEYTLTATPIDVRIRSLAVTFRVQN